jgi:uncharacterized membrane protein YhaH (DUF805 family)
MKYYVDAFRKYFVFHGRTSRKAYWMFILFNIIIGWIVMLVDRGTGMQPFLDYEYMSYSSGPLYSFYNLLLFIPSLAIACRRLHDTGRSAWWLFILLIPVFGWIWMLIILLQQGDFSENTYGSIPEDFS